jgi:multiple sugar transport system substrate-binding protein
MEKSERASRKTFQLRLEAMVEAIRGDIASGSLKKGDFLPSEKMYAGSYRLSNNTVRKGLDELVAEGLIEKVPRVGNKVVGREREQTTVLRFGCHVSLLQEAAMKTLVAEFHKRNPDIRIELVAMSPELNRYSSVKKRIDEESLDVFTMNYNGFDSFRENEGFGQLESFEPDSHIYPFLNEAFTHDGQLKLRPLLFTPLILCYNKAHFREKGLMEPDSGWRWDTLFEAADRLTVERERFGFYFHFPSSNRWPVLFMQSGLRFERNGDGGFVADERKLKEALMACRTIYLRNRFPMFLSEEDSDAEELFFKGKVSMILTTYLGLNRHERRGEFEYDIAPLPYLNEPKTLLMLVGLAISARAKEKESARRFVDYLVSHEAQMLIRRKTLSIPSEKPAAEWTGEESMYRPYRFHMYREIIPSFRTFRDLNMSVARLESLYKEAKLYWSGLETEEEAVRRLVQLLAAPAKP